MASQIRFCRADDEIVAIPVASEHPTPLTMVRLLGYRQPYFDECPRSLEAIAQRTVGHFLPLFLNPQGPTFTLNDQFEEIDLRAFYRTHFETLATRREFVVAGQPNRSL